MLYNIWSLLLSQLQTLQASWPLSSIHQSPCISKSKYILLHNHRSVIKFEKFRIDSYFLTDGPYLNVASPPRAVPSLHTTPIRGASQGLWVAWSCLISSVSVIIFSWHWYFLKMVGCMEFCWFGYVWLFVHEQTQVCIWQGCCGSDAVSSAHRTQMHMVSVGPIVGHGNSDNLLPCKVPLCLVQYK